MVRVYVLSAGGCAWWWLRFRGDLRKPSRERLVGYYLACRVIGHLHGMGSQSLHEGEYYCGRIWVLCLAYAIFVLLLQNDHIPATSDRCLSSTSCVDAGLIRSRAPTPTAKKVSNQFHYVMISSSPVLFPLFGNRREVFISLESHLYLLPILLR